MCLIIRRPPKIKPHFDQFKTAILNNPHGWGMSVALGDGSLKTLRTHEEPDPEKLYRLFTEEWGDLPALLHLRYTTAGATVLRNSHPFPILEKNQDGVDLRMCHNGTLYSYKPNTGDESDTRVFVRNFVRPLFKRLIRGMDCEEILKDQWVRDLLDSELTSLSVLSFIDGFGNTLDVNPKGNGGNYTENGIFFSNKYSFDPEHRKPKKHSVVGFPKTNGNAGSNTTTTTGTVNHTDGPRHAKDTKVQKYTEKFDLTHIEELLETSDETIDFLVDESPDDAKLLIKELLFELYREVKGLDDDE